ncbi:hypothetical protein ACIBCH_03420 [Amycolatopsis thailandensis]|uniref:hypothetical protein n=1 Tax=Amycolatopsis thailandensis TaxID=589330 RepID=UPI0037A70C5F
MVDGVEVISGRGHVTLVDLASSLRHALDRFSSGEDAAIDFTESAEVIQLRHDVNRVLITSSQHEWQVSVDREVLVSAFVEFVREAHFRLIEFLPELAENPVIRRLSSG